MQLTKRLLTEFQKRLKIGNRRGVHLNAIPANSRYKFDLHRLSHIDTKLPTNFIRALLSEKPLKFNVSWKGNVSDLYTLFEEEQTQLVKITKAFENLINQTEAIESEKGINTFGFGFPLLVRRDNLDSKLTVAPILIWSLRIHRTREFNTWEIHRNEEDPIYINEVLINHLQNDAKVEIDQIPGEMLEDGLIEKQELVEICNNILTSVNPTVPFDLLKTLHDNIDNVKAIKDKAYYEKLTENTSNSIIEFGGLFSIYEVQKQNIIQDFDELIKNNTADLSLDDLKNHSFQSISSVETDPSQQSILHDLENKRNILIQGPPGTGKSQTLTAILINALENEKKVIVVCEKRTALEVLHNTLKDKGLGHNCILIRDITKDRKSVVDSVRDRVDNSEYKKYSHNFSKDELGRVLFKAKHYINRINRKHQELDKNIFGSKRWPDLVGKLLFEIRKNESETHLNIPISIFEYTPDEFERFLEIVSLGEESYKNYINIGIDSLINSNKFDDGNPHQIERKIKSDFHSYELELNAIKNLLQVSREEYIVYRKQDINNQFLSLDNALSYLNTIDIEFQNLINKIKEDYFHFRHQEFKNQYSEFQSLKNEIEAVFKRNEDKREFLNDSYFKTLNFKLFRVLSKRKRDQWRDYKLLVRYISKLNELLTQAPDLPHLKFTDSLVELKEILTTVHLQIQDIKNIFDEVIKNELNEFGFDNILQSDLSTMPNYVSNKKVSKTKIHQFHDDTDTKIRDFFKHKIGELEFHLNNVSKSKDLEIDISALKSISQVKEYLERYHFNYERSKNNLHKSIDDEFDELLRINSDNLQSPNDTFPSLKCRIDELANKFVHDKWIDSDIETRYLNVFLTKIEEYINWFKTYINDAKDIFTIEYKWFYFYNQLNSKEKIVIDELVKYNDWRRLFTVFYLNSLLTHYANSDLPTSDDDLIEYNKSTKEIEREQLRYIKDYWYANQINEARRFELKSDGLTIENLFNKRSSIRNKRLTLRQIVLKDPNLFTSYFPIILTTPDVASNLFKGMNGFFDIVMFDEASQLRIEDNLPAILKGKQIIIAGDEHQMPPSNYFSKVFDGSVEDEDDIEEENDQIKIDKDDFLLSCESLLDFANELNFFKKHLDFHYRSRHPYLIDFSNYAFYSQRLKPLPNTFDYCPIKYIQVNGTFSDHINESEAEIVLSIIEKNIKRLPSGKYPSVGVATFNIAQRNLIKSKILERQKFQKYNEFNEKIKELEANGLFIKNLENIQGDERDVIILSTTYGVDKNGRFQQRFGPINHSKGYKLLNVIVTRAKYKVYCCTSIPENLLLNYNDYLVTEGSNNRRAVLYAYLAYCKAVSENDTISRINVLESLAKNTSKNNNLTFDQLNELESPFEEEVFQVLLDHFGADKLFPQFQFAGFRIDIVYDTKHLGKPKIAIECDGAKYHSSKEAYLYDRHRQKILEGHGFVFHRIWSTNWWRNPKREIERLLKFINDYEADTSKNQYANDDLTDVFKDDFQNIETYIGGKIELDVEKEKAIIHEINNNVPDKESEQFQLQPVKIMSKIQIKYLNNLKEINLEICKEQSHENKKTELQRVFYKKPIAQALLGHSVGDIVKIGSLDNYVEIIKIDNSNCALC